MAALFYGGFAEVVGLGLGGALGLVYMVPSVCWQVVTGREPSGEGSVAGVVQRLLQWPTNLFRYAYTGEGEFQWVP